MSRYPPPQPWPTFAALLSLPGGTIQSLVMVLMHHYTTYCISKGSMVDHGYLSSTVSSILNSIGKQAGVSQPWRGSKWWCRDKCKLGLVVQPVLLHINYECNDRSGRSRVFPRWLDGFNPRNSLVLGARTLPPPIGRCLFCCCGSKVC